MNQGTIHDGERDLQEITGFFPCEIIGRKGKGRAVSKSDLVGEPERRIIYQARASNLSEQFVVAIEPQPVLPVP